MENEEFEDFWNRMAGLDDLLRSANPEKWLSACETYGENAIFVSAKGLLLKAFSDPHPYAIDTEILDAALIACQTAEREWAQRQKLQKSTQTTLRISVLALCVAALGALMAVLDFAGDKKWQTDQLSVLMEISGRLEQADRVDRLERGQTDLETKIMELLTEIQQANQRAR